MRKIKAKIFGTKERPRISIFRSNKHIYVQIIDDFRKITILSGSDTEIKDKKNKTKTQIAFDVGQMIAKKAKRHSVKKVVFDRGNYKYHGRVKALAEGARKDGLLF